MEMVDIDSFVCPECGSHETESEICVSTEPTEDPWSGVLKIIVCAGCHQAIPAHIGGLWGGLTEDKARREWTDVYRGTSCVTNAEIKKEILKFRVRKRGGKLSGKTIEEKVPSFNWKEFTHIPECLGSV